MVITRHAVNELCRNGYRVHLKTCPIAATYLGLLGDALGQNPVGHRGSARRVVVAETEIVFQMSYLTEQTQIGRQSLLERKRKCYL